MKHYILSALLAGTALGVNAQVTTAPGDRIDTYSDAENFSSILVDNIKSITYEGSPLTGYTHIVVTTHTSTFKMPIQEIHRLAYTPVNNTPHEIARVEDEHSEIRMYFNHNDPSSDNPIDPTKPYGWFGGPAGDPVFFMPASDKGYYNEYKVEGQYSGFNYTDVSNFVMAVTGDFTAQFGIGLDCLMYTMPFEPVTMTVTSFEKNDYEGMAILGKYVGTRLGSTTNRIISGTSAEATLEMKANTTFEFSTDEGDNSISQIDCFTYDADKNMFTHIPDPEDANKHPLEVNVVWTIDGVFEDSGLVFLEATYVPNPEIKNNRQYIVSRDSFTYTIADADDYGFRRIMEVKFDNGKSTYMLLEDYNSSHTYMTAEFAQGASMSDSPCKAYFSVNGQRKYLYTHTEGNAPVITAKGNEAGSFTGDNGNLELDGFGEANYNGNSYSYTVDGTSINLIDADGATVASVIIDLNTHTYKVKSEAKWNGAKEFTTTTARGGVFGYDEYETEYVTVNLTLDKTPNGADAEGKASVYICIPNYESYVINASGDYTYDDTNSTITVSNIGIYTKVAETGDRYTDYEYKRMNIVFHVAADGKSAYIGSENVGNRIYTSRYGSYVVTGEGCTLTAVGADEPETPAENITGTYTGTAQMKTYFGSTAACDVTLTINDSNAHIDVKGMGTMIISSDATYEYADGTLTLKGVQVGKSVMSYETTTIDLTFTFDNGTLTAAPASFYGDANASNDAIMIEVILDGATLTNPDYKAPAPAVDITGTYESTVKATSASYNMDIDGQMTLTITESEAKLNISIMNADMITYQGAYEFNGSTLTLKNVEVGNGDQFSGLTEQKDITFTYADGKLTGNGQFYGANSVTCSFVADLSTFTATKQ